MSWSVFWPLYTVYPIATIGFYVNYLVVFPSVAQRVLKTRYERLDKVSKLCFIANLGSIVHSYAVVLLILIALASDVQMRMTRVMPHINMVGYSAVCFTLAYFSLSLPWNLYMRYSLKRHDVVPGPMLVHHVMVVVGAGVYIVSGVCAFYGAVAFFCMELTNLFFVPRVVVDIIGGRIDGPLCTVNGILLVLTFVLFRVGVTTAAAVVFTIDLTQLDASASALELVCIVIAYVTFLGVLLLSWIWLQRVLKECKDGVNVLLDQRRAQRSQQATMKQIAVRSSSKVHPAESEPV